MTGKYTVIHISGKDEKKTFTFGRYATLKDARSAAMTAVRPYKIMRVKDGKEYSLYSDKQTSEMGGEFPIA